MKNLLILVIILLLSACGDQTIRQDKPQYSGLQQAEQYFDGQMYNKAARAYEHLFMNYKEDIFALKAADSWMRIKQFQNAQNLIDSIKISQNTLYLLIQSELYVNAQKSDAALRTFNQIPQNYNQQYETKYLYVKSKVYSKNLLFLDAALALIELSSIEKNNDYTDAIINNLVQTSELELTQALFKMDATEYQLGWLEAAYIAYTQDSESTKQWKNRWKDHPAKAFFSQINQYNNIAVLLPLTGKYKEISDSIRDGMMAALYRNGSAQQNLTFFDTGSESQFFSYAWYGAIESGAEFIVGPLLKDSIKQLTQLNSSTIPVMLLNELEKGDENFQGFYQFALSQEDEVRNVANRLKAENKKRIMILAPESESGRSLARLLEQNILFNDGQVISYEFYPESTHDYSREIKQALGLNESLIRKRQLQTIIKQNIKSTTQIRPDIDAIVILARPKQARLIKPQLKFYQAEDIPVYSTSLLLSSAIDTNLDKDLNGIKFCQSAFVIDPNSMQNMLNFDTSELKTNKKFFAFGYDAIALTPRLNWLQTMQNQTIESMSGELSIGPNGKILRDLSWGQFVNGKPVLLPPLQNQIPQASDEILY